MNKLDQHYYRRRRGEENAAANAANLPEVRRVHRELAERYSALIEGAERPRLFGSLHIVASSRREPETALGPIAL